jgi:hypothetical protein
VPHRAGYFVLAYSWDHHCEDLVAAIEGRLETIRQSLAGLESQNTRDAESLLRFFKAWHYSNDLYRLCMKELESRQFVINSFGYRGYGVNKDLLGALGALAAGYSHLEQELTVRFLGRARPAKKAIYLPRECVEAKSSGYIIRELCRKLDLPANVNIAWANERPAPDLEQYLRVMSETPWHTNTAIFQKMFLSAGACSMTIMKGSTGLHGRRPCRELKLIGNRNFTDTCRHIFASLHNFTEIGTGLLRETHYRLSKGLDPNAGQFRQTDFPDRNGVTFEFDNFQREVSDLDIVLGETARSFHDMDTFIYNLARSYYMIIGIHPFWDSNGRTARCFLNRLLLKKGLPPVLIDDEELFALPRYGGSMEDMHDYLKSRLQRATEDYFHERRKLKELGHFGKPIYNVSFDSGFHFRQIGEARPRVEVHFEVRVSADAQEREDLQNQCVVVLPQKELVHSLVVYCGLSGKPFDEWRDPFTVEDGFSIEEHRSGRRAPVFDVDFCVDLPASACQDDHLSCCVACPSEGLIFNNKGLNYSYRLDL